MDVLTTLLHLAALNAALPAAYNAMVLAATVTSAVWHADDEKNRALGVLDYGLAGLWFLADAAGNAWTIPLNLLVFTAFLSMDNHAAWHCISAAKAAYVSHYLLTG